MTAIAFQTTTDAVAAGYRPARKGLIERYNGAEIVVADTSGPDAFGYSFAICAKANTRSWPIYKFSPALAESVSIVLKSERNKINASGCVGQFFKIADYEAAIETARAYIDDQSSKWNG
jgi:hypothetical protein